MFLSRSNRFSAFKVGAVFSFLIVSGCENFPYHPEPFGAFEYDENGELQETKKKWSIATKGAVLPRPNPLISISSIDNYSSVQDNYLKHFALMSASAFSAGEISVKGFGSTTEKLPLYVSAKGGLIISKPPYDNQKVTGAITASWEEVTKNAWNYVDAVCADYLRQLDRLKRNNRGLKNLTSNTASTVNTVLGLFNTSTTHAMSIVAAAFGLADNVFDIYRDTILTKLEFSSVHQMVKRMHFQYKVLLLTDAQNKIDTRSEAVNAIQSYLFICTPYSLEANINNAVQGKSIDQFLVNSGLMPVSGSLLGELDIKPKIISAPKITPKSETTTSKAVRKAKETAAVTAIKGSSD